MLFSSVWFGLLWSAATPYIKKLVPQNSYSFGQGIWVVVSSGAATLSGSYLGGIVSEAFGMKTLFLGIAVVLAALTAVTPWLVKE